MSTTTTITPDTTKDTTLDAAFTYAAHSGAKTETDASTASMQSSQLTVTLPDPVSGWPTSWITAEEFERYIGALYDSGWGIRFSSANSKPTKSHPSRVVPELLKTYHFNKSDEFAAKFVNDLKELMTEENHHCVLHVADTQVTVYMHTHSACPALGSKRAPGITLRDVRFAILADLLHSNDFIAKDAGNPSPSHVQSLRLTWDGYQNSIRATMAPVEV